MIVEKKPWIGSVIEEHFEELQALWLLRQNKLVARDWFVADLDKLDRRIAAHVDGLVLSVPQAEAMFDELLAGNEEQVFSACLPLLYYADRTEQITVALKKAKVANLMGFAYAFGLMPRYVERRDVHGRVDLTGPALEAVALGLAYHGNTSMTSSLAEKSLGSEHGPQEVNSWRLLAHSAGISISPETLESAWSSADPFLVQAATRAVLWSAQPWLLQYCRQQVTAKTSFRLPAGRVLAILGGDTDLPLIESIATDDALPADRLQVVSDYGRAKLIPLLCERLKSEDMAVKIMAGKEFHRLTGINVETTQLATLPANSANSNNSSNPARDEASAEFEAAFDDDELIPDSERAEEAWKQHQQQWSSGRRIHRGTASKDEEQIGSVSADLVEQAQAMMRLRCGGNVR
ncbi:MAG: hypothetical protein IT423_00490, partial [Pirellulaceae bacterium]|nr:hypothetical protein [Pirellulaceae bacterium]